MKTTTVGRSGSGPRSASSPIPYLALIRPVNGAIASAAVLVGAFVSRWPTAWPPGFLGAACAFLAASAANALNDVVDREADALNRPARPIPSGRVTPRGARWAALVLYAGALSLAIPLGSRALVLVSSWVVLTALYSRFVKGVPVAGNVLASLVAASPFVLGGLTQGKVLLSLVPFALAFLVHLAREAVKDAGDKDGDARAGVRTLAVARGAGASVVMARVFIALAMAAAPLPYLARLYGAGYGAAVLFIEMLFVRELLILRGRPGADRLERASNGLKLVMLAGLVAFVLGVI